MGKPSVDVRPVASRYAARDERIVEFDSEAGGGLISLQVVGDRLIVQVYRTDPMVTVVAEQKAAL